MANLFTELNGHVTQEQIKQINKTGVVPPDAKSPEEKKYFIIFKYNFKYNWYKSK